MRIEELSVGDWVQSPVTGIAYKVDGLWRDELGEFLIIKGNRLCADMVEPIPLTPEILGKNGWNKIVRNIKYQTWIKGDIYIRKHRAEEWYRLFIGRFEMRFNLYHTHQLQHALRLAGVEKEIEV